MPGTREKIYAHHAAFALFHGPWTAGEQIHHRTQDATELSPWTLEAVPISEHEQRKQLPPDRMPVEVPRLEELVEFTKAYDLPLPWSLRKRAGSGFTDSQPTKEPAMVIDLNTHRKRRAEQLPTVPPRFVAPSNQAIYEALDRTQREKGQDIKAQLHYLRTGSTA